MAHCYRLTSIVFVAIFARPLANSGKPAFVCVALPLADSGQLDIACAAFPFALLLHVQVSTAERQYPYLILMSRLLLLYPRIHFCQKSLLVDIVSPW